MSQYKMAASGKEEDGGMGYSQNSQSGVNTDSGMEYSMNGGNPDKDGGMSYSMTAGKSAKDSDNYTEANESGKVERDGYTQNGN